MDPPKFDSFSTILYYMTAFPMLENGKLVAGICSKIHQKNQPIMIKVVGMGRC